MSMFELDKKKFGAFVAQLRKEKGYTQKELAKHLFISDKAVSKWETGASIPDTALLIPLAERLGVSVTELLMCERMVQGASLETDQVEDIVKAAISYTDEKPERAYQQRSKWPVFYGLSFLAGCAGMLLNDVAGKPLEILATFMSLCAVFGAYFCIFVKTKLPAFYDENHINVFYDGVFRMNMPGLKFNNRNWPYIVKAIRVWACVSMVIFPILSVAASNIGLKGWNKMGDRLLLVLFLCGLLIPVYVIGKKHES